MQILEEEEKHHVQDFQEIVDVMCFSSSKNFISVGVFGFLNKGIVK